MTQQGNPRTDLEDPTPESSAAPQAAQSEEPQQPQADSGELEQLKAELSAARKRIDELSRGLQAADRDREEFKQRLGRERDRLIDVERGKVAVDLLEAIDELDLCLTATSSEKSALAQGVRLIRDNLLRKAEKSGIERMKLEGLP